MRAFLVFVLLSLVSISPARSTTLLRFDLETLTANAVQIFVGTCVASATEIVDGQVYTHTRFAVSQALKGDLSDQVSVYLPGGEHEQAQMQIVGMPTFAANEEVVLFLTPPNQRGHVWPVGLTQGKFHLERDGALKAHVSQDVDGISFYTPSGAAKQSAVQENLQDVPLEEFLERIQSLIDSDDGGRDAH